MNNRIWITGQAAGLLLLALAGGAAAQTQAVAPAPSSQPAANVYPIGPGLIIAGKPDAATLSALPDGAVVIDLRTAEEGIEADAAEAARLGLEYHNVPMSGVELSDAQVAAVAGLLAAAGGRTVFLHCASGNRAGLMWGAVQMREGAPLADVMTALEPVPLCPPVVDALQTYACHAGQACPPETATP